MSGIESTVLSRHYADESGMFADFNFKLIVIDQLLDRQPSFADALEEMKARYVQPFELYRDDRIIPEMAAFFAGLRLTQEDLDQVQKLYFDGGDNVYFLIKPDWDGELDYFDVTSIAGAEKLRNLRSVYWTSMCSPELLRPLYERGILVDCYLFPPRKKGEH